MSMNTPAGHESPATTDDSFTEHVEPPAQGGRRYLRCTECGDEVIGTDPDRMPHRPGCSLA